MKNELIKSTNNYLGRELGLIGLQRKGDRFFYEIASGIIGRVDLNISRHRGGGIIGVSPTISIESMAVRSELNRLIGQKATTPQPSLSTSLGYLMPENRFLEWLLRLDEPFDQREEIPRMCMAIKLYGLQFFRENGTFQNITRCLEKREYSFNERVVYQLPIIYRLNGRDSQGRAFVATHLAEMKGKQDIASNDYRAFANMFLKDAIGIRATVATED